MEKDKKFVRFCEIIAEHPGISANKYDRLVIKDRPARTPLQKKFNCSWNGLVTLVATSSNVVPKKPAGKVGMTRSSFLEQFDEDARVREAIRSGIGRLKLASNASDPEDDVILTELDFRLDFCGNIPAQYFGKIARGEEFRDYRFRSKGKVFWTTPRTKKWALEHVSSAREL